MELEPVAFDQNSLNPAIEPPPSAEQIEEFLETLRKRRSYLIGEAAERTRRGLRTDFETREARALAWALSIVEDEDEWRERSS